MSSFDREARTPTWPYVAEVVRLQADQVHKIHNGVATAGDDLERPKLIISLHNLFFAKDTVGIEPLKL